MLNVLLILFLFVGGITLTNNNLPMPDEYQVSKIEQEELLYSILGYLDYAGDGKLKESDIPSMRKGLEALIEKNHLDGITGAAYVYNKKHWNVAWGKPLEGLSLAGLFDSRTYDLQFVEMGQYRIAVLNFWMRTSPDEKEYFQLIVVRQRP